MPSAPNTVLIISSEFPPNVGGIGNHAYNLAKALANEGYRVDVMADIIDVTQSELADFAAQQNFTIHWVERRQVVVLSYAERILKALTLAKKADKIICSGKFSLWIANLLRRRFSRKDLIAVVHGTELDFKSTITKSLTSRSLGKFNKIISVSNYTAGFLPAALPASVKKFIIHNGINCAEFATKETTPLAGAPALITVGNVTDRKGQENVVNALPEILVDFPSAQYHVVGKPTNKIKIESQALALGVEKSVAFYGAVSRAELLQKLKGASIKLMLSNHTAEGDFEGFGIAVLEANAFGVPAIGSKNSGIADAIEDGVTGLLVNQLDAKEVANAVKTINNNYSYFSANAKVWAGQHDWKIIVKEYKVALNA